MWNKQFVKFLFFSFGLVIVVNIVHPVTPQFIKNTGTGTWIFGYMFASMSIGSMLMARRWGAISDKYGRKYTLLIPICFFYALAQLLMSISTSVSMILFARMLSGMVGAAALWTIMPAYISDISKSKNKIKAQIILNSVVGFATPVGYLFGGWLGVTIGPSKTIMVQALLAVFMFVPGYFLIDNNTNIISRQGVKIKTTWETIKQYRGKNLFLFCFSILPFFIFRKTGQKFLDVLLLNESGFNSLQIGGTIMWIGLFSTSFILIVAPFISRKIKDLNLLIFLSLWIGILLITAGLFRNIPFIIQIFFIAETLRLFFHSVQIGFITKHFKNHQGEVLGIMKSFIDIGNIIGPLLIGAIFVVSPWAAFIVLGFIVLITFSSIIILKKQFQYKMKGD